MNKCIKIENIYIFMINSYCKYIDCVSILNVDMAETMDTEAGTMDTGAGTMDMGAGTMDTDAGTMDTEAETGQ
jgi:hypothetical protein